MKKHGGWGSIGGWGSMGEWDRTAWRPEMGWERPDKEAGPDVIEITTELLFNQLPTSRRFLIPDSGQAACS